MADLVGIIDYGMGNIKSVFNAIDFLGEEAVILDKDGDFDSCSHLILPGVGSYAKAMNHITRGEIDKKIINHIKNKKPLMGICLGMQLLSSLGFEGGETSGLSIIEGEVTKLDVPLHIPHVGWNNIELKAEHPIFNDVKKNVDFYFVHSYEFKLKDQLSLLATVDYSRDITAVVTDNKSAVGIQFHPEKSQENGLKILENFCEWEGDQ